MRVLKFAGAKCSMAVYRHGNISQIHHDLGLFLFLNRIPSVSEDPNDVLNRTPSPVPLPLLHKTPPAHLNNPTQEWDSLL